MRITKQLAGIAAVLFFTMSNASWVPSLQEPSSYAIQANIIYHFTKYIDWPEAKKSEDFIIGIVGDITLVDELKKIVTNKTVRNQKIIVKKFSASPPLFNCHILYISEGKSGSLKKIAAGTAGDAILLVTESEGLASKGSCINFVVVEERLKLEINKNNIQQRDLSIANELLSLGKLVK